MPAIGHWNTSGFVTDGRHGSWTVDGAPLDIRAGRGSDRFEVLDWETRAASPAPAPVNIEAGRAGDGLYFNVEAREGRDSVRFDLDAALNGLVFDGGESRNDTMIVSAKLGGTEMRELELQLDTSLWGDRVSNMEWVGLEVAFFPTLADSALRIDVRTGDTRDVLPISYMPAATYESLEGWASVTEDEALASAPVDIYANTGAGRDLVRLSLGQSDPSGTAKIRLGEGRDEFWGDWGGDALITEIWAGQGRDTVAASNGNTTVHLAGGNDLWETRHTSGSDEVTVFGGTGYDTFQVYHPTGRLELHGGRGGDLFSLDVACEVTIADFESGRDWIGASVPHGDELTMVETFDPEAGLQYAEDTGLLHAPTSDGGFAVIDLLGAPFTADDIG